MFFASYLHTNTSPENRRKLIHSSLTARWISPRLHYETSEQAQMWLALHRKYSPTASQETESVYHNAFAEFVLNRNVSSVQVISLGCGGGNKDALLLRLLQSKASAIQYFPCDVSADLVLEASLAAHPFLPERSCTPIIAGLESAADLKELLSSKTSVATQRIFLFFGLLPSMKPADARACLRCLLKPGDILLASANLSPEENDISAIQRILPQYDNNATREWLIILLRNLGMPKDAGRIRFEAKTFPGEETLQCILGFFEFEKDIELRIDDRTYPFRGGEQLTLFFPFVIPQLLLSSFYPSFKWSPANVGPIPPKWKPSLEES